MIIEESGGAFGLLDKGALESSIAAPFATYSGEDLHENVFDKAAALMRSLSLNHPFNDGNKRTSLMMTAVFLLEHGYGIREDVSDDEIVDFCISLAKGEAGVREISEWLKSKTVLASGKSFTNVMSRLHSH